jgi:hypothetical protein
VRATTISKEVYKAGQELRYNEVLNTLIGSKKHKLRVRICSDSYRNQCSAKIERWSGSTWNTVHFIDDMKTPDGLAYRRSSGETDFKTDRDELLRVAERVLS